MSERTTEVRDVALHQGAAEPATGTTTNAATRPSTGGPERMIVRLIHDQDLTPAQELQLVEIRRSLLTKWQGLHQALAALEPALRAELTKPAPDAATVHGLTDRALALHRALAHAVTDEALALTATFSEAQRELVVSRSRTGTVGVPRRADATALARAMVSTRASGASREPWTALTETTGTLKANDLALRVFDGPGLTAGEEKLRRDARRELRDGEASVDAAVSSETDGLLRELAKPAEDASAIHAAVDRVLAVHAKAAHAVADRALSLSAALTPQQKSAFAR